MSEQTFGSRLKHAWNVFRAKDEPSEFLDYHVPYNMSDYGIATTSRTDRVRLTPTTERTYIASIYNKIAVDVAAVPIKHVKINQNGGYEETIKSSLNNCLNLEANLDQTGREFIMDVVLSMFDEGVVAIVPVETSFSPLITNSYDILQMRTGKITQWYPQNVKVEVYDERDGLRKEVVLPKRKVAIIENPFYSIMNQPNSVLKRLINKLNLLDNVDAMTYSAKLNIILQLPYTIKSDARKEQAEKRLSELEKQLEGSKYGAAYIDGTEKITQLNRAVENELIQQINDLKKDLFSQMGITESVFDGTADEKTMLNYRNGTVEPILSAITNEMIRKFLTKTAQTQGQTLKFIQDPFRLVPVNEMAEIADKFTRNEIMSPNELRSIIGVGPVQDNRADELRNRNLNVSDEQINNPVLVEEE